MLSYLLQVAQHDSAAPLRIPDLQHPDVHRAYEAWFEGQDDGRTPFRPVRRATVQDWPVAYIDNHTWLREHAAYLREVQDKSEATAPTQSRKGRQRLEVNHGAAHAAGPTATNSGGAQAAPPSEAVASSTQTLQAFAEYFAYFDDNIRCKLLAESMQNTEHLRGEQQSADIANIPDTSEGVWLFAVECSGIDRLRFANCPCNAHSH